MVDQMTEHACVILTISRWESLLNGFLQSVKQKICGSFCKVTRFLLHLTWKETKTQCSYDQFEGALSKCPAQFSVTAIYSSGILVVEKNVLSRTSKEEPDSGSRSSGRSPTSKWRDAEQGHNRSTGRSQFQQGTPNAVDSSRWRGLQGTIPTTKHRAKVRWWSALPQVQMVRSEATGNRIITTCQASRLDGSRDSRTEGQTNPAQSYGFKDIGERCLLLKAWLRKSQLTRDRIPGFALWLVRI
ncbi:unnamed protein product [Fraxinus pennsylvanica]|uniref:Uncharacterized protein n=1 Tax=Fraxinus pennsylvanica TaxID=56036 RepID=A0AAD2A4T6_9LAMI|nr:unnamed protein product [Fraxinus pennsylvanica]